MNTTQTYKIEIQMASGRGMTLKGGAYNPGVIEWIEVDGVYTYEQAHRFIENSRFPARAVEIVSNEN